MLPQTVLILLLLHRSLALSESTAYEGYKVYDVNAKNGFEKETLLLLAADPAYDFFLLPRALGVPARVMVPPRVQSTFESVLQQFGIRYSLVSNNFGESVANAAADKLYSTRSANATSDRFSFSSFHRYDTLNNYLDDLVRDHPKRVRVERAGQSFEGREIRSVTISNGDGRTDKKVIFVDAGMHAREWIAPAAALYIVHQLVDNYEANDQLLQDYDWVVLPLVNPDGYEYSHTTKRMWRKTRKPVTKECTGTDANRNFNFHWGEVGASDVSCADTFRGVSAFSEPETRAVRDLMRSLSGRAKLYLTIHSYGNYLLYPWGYTPALPSSWQDMDEVAQAGAAAIHSATGTKYTVGSSTNVLYAAAGGSDDYAFAKADIPVSITMELSGGGSGFDPAPSQIKPFVEEAWIGIKAMTNTIMKKY